MPSAREQSKNQKMVDQIESTNNTLNAGLTGTTNDAVLRFAAAGTVVGSSDFIVDAVTAADGSSIVINKPGVYAAQLVGMVGGAATVHFGISLDVAAAGLTGDPTLATAGMLTVARATGVAALVMPVTLTATFVIRETAAAGAATGVVRFHATNGAGAAPAGITVVADVSYRLLRLNDLEA